MLSLEAVLQDLYPGRELASWKKELLRNLLCEERFVTFAQKYPHLRGVDCVEQVLEEIGVHTEVVGDGPENIPTEGPVVIVSNHPLGMADGLVLLRAVAKVRPDVKAVANQLLGYLEPLRSLFIMIDNMGGKINRKQVEEVHSHLQKGGALIVFPAGEVSRLKLKGVRDEQWNSGFLRFAAKARTPIVPVHISARNSLGFYMASCIYKPLSTMFLVKEMFRQKGNSVKVTIGRRVPFANWHGGNPSWPEVAGRFRNHVYRLVSKKPDCFVTETPIALPEDRGVLKRALEACEVLGTTPDGKTIYLYQRNGEDNVPVLRELGRLREVAFRAVGEGSGKRRDIDRYDDDYYHLILWDPKALDIVGAYRFMPVAELAANKRTEGLYSASLFDYGPEIDEILACGIEMGRSFIQPIYWGKRGLDYLWQGIGAYLARYPQYRYLFGPVSISAALPAAARDLLVAFYRLYFAPAGALARSRRAYPPSSEQVMSAFEGNDYAQDMVRLKNMLSNMGVAIPTLYKQYSELCEPDGVQFIDFGIDPDFSDCVDGLVLVDAYRLKPLKHQRYIAPYRQTEEGQTQEHQAQEDQAQG